MRGTSLCQSTGDLAPTLADDTAETAISDSQPVLCTVELDPWAVAELAGLVHHEKLQ